MTAKCHFIYGIGTAPTSPVNQAWELFIKKKEGSIKVNPLSTRCTFRFTAIAVCLALLLAVIASALPHPAIAKTPCDSYYKVKEGDTSSKIAHTFGLKWKEIALANNIKDPSKLKVGQVLCIPPKAYTTETIFVTVIGRRVQIPASGFTTKNLFYVKVRDGSVSSLQEGLHYAAIAVSSVFSVLWTLSHRMGDGMAGFALVAVGIISIVGGLWGRKDHWFTSACSSHHTWPATASMLLMAFGIAAMTTSPLVVGSAGCVCVATWFRHRTRSHEPKAQATNWIILREGAVVGSLCLALLTLATARGILPFR